MASIVPRGPRQAKTVVSEGGLDIVEKRIPQDAAVRDLANHFGLRLRHHADLFPNSRRGTSPDSRRRRIQAGTKRGLEEPFRGRPPIYPPGRITKFRRGAVVRQRGEKLGFLQKKATVRVRTLRDTDCADLRPPTSKTGTSSRGNSLWAGEICGPPA